MKRGATSPAESKWLGCAGTAPLPAAYRHQPGDLRCHCHYLYGVHECLNSNDAISTAHYPVGTLLGKKKGGDS